MHVGGGAGEGWLDSKANTPTGVHMSAGLQAWPGPCSRAHYLFSQFKALAAAHAASAGPSNALLIATLRLPSPQTHIGLHVPATKSTSAASSRGGGGRLTAGGVVGFFRNHTLLWLERLLCAAWRAGAGHMKGCSAERR